MYPAYYAWCIRNGVKPLNHNYFTAQLLQNAKMYYGGEFIKTRQKYGIYISGISLKKNIFDRDYIHGAPLAAIAENVVETSMLAETSAFKNSSDFLGKDSINGAPIAVIAENIVEENGSDNIKKGFDYISPAKGQLHGALQEDFYEYHQELISKNSLKDKLNSILKNYLAKSDKLIDARLITDQMTAYLNVNTKDFYDKVFNNVKAHLNYMKDKEFIPFTYKDMGISLREETLNYHNRRSTIERVINNYLYNTIAERANLLAKNQPELNIKIAYFNIEDCLVSIINDLFSDNKSRIVETALNNKGGISGFIRQNYFKKEKKHFYNERVVKTGLLNAIYNQNELNLRNDILSEYEIATNCYGENLTKTSFFEEISAITDVIVAEMRQCTLMHSLREYSLLFLKLYNNKSIRDPTGAKYLFDEDTFKGNFLIFLESFEFVLITQGILYAVKKVPEITLLHHMEGGAIIYFPLDKETEAISALKDSVDKVRKDLGIASPLKLKYSVFMDY